MAPGSRYSIVMFVALAISCIFPCLSASAAPSTGNGLTSETTYESPNYGYEVEWAEPWLADPDITVSEPGFDFLALASADALVTVGGFDVARGSDPAALVDTFIETYSEDDPGATIVERTASGNRASALVEYANSGVPSRVQIDATVFAREQFAMVSTILAPISDFDAAVISAQAITIDGKALGGGGGGSGSAAPRDQSRAPDTAEPRGRDKAATGPADLAAMPLTPSDLDALGFEDFQFSDRGGRVRTLDAVVKAVAQLHDVDENVVREQLEAAGWQREYQRTALLLRDPADARSGIVTEVTTEVTEYADADGAAAGFALLEDEPASIQVDQYTSGAEDVPGTRTFGDESEITIATSTTQGKTSYLSIELTFRIDNLVAAVRINQDTASGRATRPQIDPIETLAGRLLERVEEVRGATDSLALLTLPLTTSEGVDLALLGEDYSRYQGETFPLKGESAADLASRADKHDAEGVVDSYNWRASFSGPEASGDYPSADVSATLRRFENEDFATAYIDGMLEWLRAGNPTLEMETVEHVQIGDQSVLIAMPFELVDGATGTFYLAAARVGPLAFLTGVQPKVTDFPRTATESVAAAQMACFEAGACAEPLDVSTLFSGGDQDAGADTGNQRESTDDRSDAEGGGSGADVGRVGQRDEQSGAAADLPGVSGNAYESPSYGYNFEWDRSWQVVAATSADGNDDLQLERNGSHLYVQGYPFAGNATDCAAATSQAYLDDAAYSDFGDLQDSAGNEIGGSDFIHADLAFSATYASSDGTATPVAIYVGCWQAHVGPNAVVRFTLVTTPDAFADAYDALQDLLGTLRI